MTSLEDAALLKLRHLYKNMVNGGVKDASEAKRIAEGLLSPAIAAIESLHAEVEALRGGWRPIESAPRDGTLIVVRGNNYGDSEQGHHHCIATWHNGCWLETSDWNATSELTHLTHWAPTPPAQDDGK